MDSNDKIINLGNRFVGFAVVKLHSGYDITINGNRSSYTFSFVNMSNQGLQNLLSDFANNIGLEMKPILVRSTMFRCEIGDTKILVGITSSIS